MSNLSAADLVSVRKLAKADFRNEDNRRNRIGRGAWLDAYIAEWDRLEEEFNNFGW